MVSSPYSLQATATPVANTYTVHNQLVFMAESFFTPDTTSILAQILEPQYNGSIGRAAAWADAYAHTSEGRFSYQWHWIDTHDWAPDNCHLDYKSDCAKGGCVVSAIANQTGILRECIQHAMGGTLVGGTNLTCSYAAKWVAHFVGDIHQPVRNVEVRTACETYTDFVHLPLVTCLWTRRGWKLLPGQVWERLH